MTRRPALALLLLLAIAVPACHKRPGRTAADVVAETPVEEPQEPGAVQNEPGVVPDEPDAPPDTAGALPDPPGAVPDPTNPVSGARGTAPDATAPVASAPGTVPDATNPVPDVPGTASDATSPVPDAPGTASDATSPVPDTPGAPSDAAGAPATPRPKENAPEMATPEGRKIRASIARARELLASLNGLGLTAEQKLNAESAESFTAKAAQALEEGDLARAAVLSDKALTLLEALAAEMRPPGG